MSPTPTYVEQPKRSGLLTALVAGAIVVLISQHLPVHANRSRMRTDMSAMHDKLLTEISATCATRARSPRHPNCGMSRR